MEQYLSGLLPAPRVKQPATPSTVDKIPLRVSSFDFSSTPGLAHLLEVLTDLIADEQGNADHVFTLRVKLGVLEFQRGNYANAIRSFKSAKALKSDDANLIGNIGLCYLYSGHLAEAYDYLKRSISLSPEAESYNNLALYKLLTGRFYDALPLVENALEKDPQLKQAWLNKGNALFFRYLDQHGCEHTPNVRHFRGGSPLTIHKAWTVDSDYSRFHVPPQPIDIPDEVAEVLSCYDRALALDGNYDKALSNRGCVLTEFKQFDNAIPDLERAVELNCERAEYWTNLGQGYLLSKVYSGYEEANEQALLCFYTALSIDPGYERAWSCLGNAFADFWEYGKAAYAYEQAVSGNRALEAAWQGNHRDWGMLCNGALRVKYNVGWLLHPNPRIGGRIDHDTNQATGNQR